MKYSVILPTYNERENIGPLIERIFALLREEAEVIVVDDNSPDGTWQVVKELQAKFSNLVLILRKDKPGLVASLEEGIKNARGGIIVWMDADGAMPPEKIPELLDGLAQGYDLVAGSRFVPGGGVELITGSPDSMTAFFLSLLLNRWCQLWLGRDFKDYTSGFVAIKKPVLEKLYLRGEYGEYFIALVYEARHRGYRWLEIPYINRPRKSGQSKTGLSLLDYLRRGWKYFWLTVRLKLIS